MKPLSLLASVAVLALLWAASLVHPAPRTATALGAAGPTGDLLAPRLDLPAPDPTFSPADVVRLQLEALADNDRPYADAGIETAYNFASPSNRQVTGDFARFAEMVRNPIYRDLIGSRHVRYGRVNVEGDVARQAVVLVTEDAQRVGYIFMLVRQHDGEYADCWLAESVARFEVRDEEPLAYTAQPVVQI